MPEPCKSCDQREKDFGGCRCQAFLLTGDARNADPVCSKSPNRHLIDEALAVVTDLETTIVTAPAYTYRAMPPTPTAGQRAKAAVGD